MAVPAIASLWVQNKSANRNWGEYKPFGKKRWWLHNHNHSGSHNTKFFCSYRWYEIVPFSTKKNRGVKMRAIKKNPSNPPLANPTEFLPKDGLQVLFLAPGWQDDIQPSKIVRDPNRGFAVLHPFLPPTWVKGLGKKPDHFLCTSNTNQSRWRERYRGWPVFYAYNYIYIYFRSSASIKLHGMLWAWPARCQWIPTHSQRTIFFPKASIIVDLGGSWRFYCAVAFPVSRR